MRSLKYFLHLLLLACVFVCVCSTNFFFGEKTPTSKLVQRDKVFYEAIPWMKRVKFYTYTGPTSLVIKVIDTIYKLIDKQNFL